MTDLQYKPRSASAELVMCQKIFPNIILFTSSYVNESLFFQLQPSDFLIQSMVCIIIHSTGEFPGLSQANVK